MEGLDELLSFLGIPSGRGRGGCCRSSLFSASALQMADTITASGNYLTTVPYTSTIPAYNRPRPAPIVHTQLVTMVVVICRWPYWPVNTPSPSPSPPYSLHPLPLPVVLARLCHVYMFSFNSANWESNVSPRLGLPLRSTDLPTAQLLSRPETLLPAPSFTFTRNC
ncbi:hypothetical protein J6590_006362 [Homalodisca vitripennis]|nr:hypothetical protein J6590_006362 [Homalodisca vitripennis]